MTISSTFSSYLANGFRQEEYYGNFPQDSMLNQVRLWQSSWSEVLNAGHNFGRGPPQDHFSKVWLRLAQQLQRRRFFKISSPFFLFLAWWPSWLEGGITGHNFGRGPSKDHSTKVLLQLAKWFLRRRFLCEFPIGSYIKLSSAVGAILVERPNRLT